MLMSRRLSIYRNLILINLALSIVANFNRYQGLKESLLSLQDMPFGAGLLLIWYSVRLFNIALLIPSIVLVAHFFTTKERGSGCIVYLLLILNTLFALYSVSQWI